MGGNPGSMSEEDLRSIYMSSLGVVGHEAIVSAVAGGEETLSLFSPEDREDALEESATGLIALGRSGGLVAKVSVTHALKLFCTAKSFNALLIVAKMPEITREFRF